MDRDNPRGWRTSDDFRPFNNFVICKNCNKPMTAGVSKGKSDRYLSVTCGHSKCKEERRAKGITPIANTIRGGVILDFMIDFLENSLKIDKKTYNLAKKKYLEGRNSLIKENVEQIKIWKHKLSKLETKEKKLTERILNEQNKNVADKLSNDCSIIINQIKELERNVNEYEIRNRDFEAEVELDFPSYDVFLNFFKDVVVAIQNTDNAYLIDQLVKLIFLNITVNEKKVLRYTLKEPFQTYENLKFLSGVM
jgi:hypothetical protein